MVISQALWRRVFGVRLTLDGASIALGPQSYHVIGVVSRGADFPNGALAWIPFSKEDQRRQSFMALARLRNGVTQTAAGDELHGIGAILTSRYAPAAHAPIAFLLNPVRVRGAELREIHVAMVGASLIVLLIACANLAHLVMARGLSRRGELALRLAIGASRRSLVTQILLECGLITIAGSVLGALIAAWGSDLLANMMPGEISWIGLIQPRLSWRVFGWSALAAGYSACLFGLLPAVRVVGRVEMNEPLKDSGGNTTSRTRHRYNWLVISEVALALVLLMSAGLLVRTVHELNREGKYGFDTNTLWRANLEFPPDSKSFLAWARRTGRDTTIVTRAEVLAVANSVQGLLDAAYEGSMPALGGAVSAENAGLSRTVTLKSYGIVSANYFRLLGLPAVRGRTLEPGDGEASMVAVIDPVAAERLYPRQDPVGKMIKLGSPTSRAGWVPIIGVARNPRVLTGADAPAQPYVWVAAPVNQIPNSALVFRTHPADATAIVTLRRRLEEIPRIGIRSIERYTYERDAMLASRRFFAGVFVAMGSMSLALTTLGLYSVLAYAVGKRIREFAVRAALGAEAKMLYRLVLHDALVMLLAGIGIGAALAMIGTRYVDSLVQGIYRIDVASLLAGEMLLLVLGLLAALLPAHRASRASPMDILRAV